MNIGMTTSLQGMQRAETQLNQVAQSVAQGPSKSAGPEGDTVDLSAQAVALIEAKNSFEANTAALKVSDQMTQTLLKSIG
ncbi:MAG TPA: flagellar basal body rod C-terminal domain-containing protein [Bryobacteraceae bacterium]|jgi:flagellar hook protein FlgE|nr:flagellar basal body rod C-terminal domain-containing protein [Bryobacteraceae bacterium]